MARDDADRVKVRGGYLSGLSMEQAAQQAGVPYDTARRWKRLAKEGGDDWDKLRSAQQLAGGGIEEVFRRVLTMADSLNKMVSASKRIMPETDELAVRLDTLKKMAEFTRQKYPQAASALVEVLGAFGEEVGRG